ncbi:MAG: hypothetical protein HZA53_13010 [Planctomycetes bacterium]|nr:hypothetical protein [Planctomycetota bacterium]
MNPLLRWNLILGCAVVAVLQLPHDAEVLAQDLRGPYGTSPELDARASGLDAAERAAWQTASNEFDPARFGADTEAFLTDPDDDDAGPHADFDER